MAVSVDRRDNEVNLMKSALTVLTALSLLLSGCCSQLKNTSTAGEEDKEWGTDLYWCGIFSGYGTAEQPERSQALYTPVTGKEYAQLLCEDAEIEDYASCMNQIRDFHRRSAGRSSGDGSSTSGPFAMRVGGEVYVGSYWGTPFNSSFRVASDRGQVCKGGYNAFYGSTEAVFDVVCDNGMRGKADIVSDRDGRNGIGYVAMNDGTKGQIAYGPDISRAAREQR